MSSKDKEQNRRLSLAIKSTVFLKSEWFWRLSSMGQAFILRQHVAVTWLIPILASCAALVISSTWKNIHYLWINDIPVTATYVLYFIKRSNPWYILFSTLPFLGLMNILFGPKETSLLRSLFFSSIALGLMVGYYTCMLCRWYKFGLPLDYWFEVITAAVLIPVLPALFVRIFLLSVTKINVQKSGLAKSACLNNKQAEITLPDDDDVQH
jgi:fructose-specific phosphotransferase system IIC component